LSAEHSQGATCEGGWILLAVTSGTRRLAAALGLVAALAGGPVCAAQLSVAVTLIDVLPIVQAVGGSAVSAYCLAPAGADPHSFTMTVDMAQRLRTADLLVCAATRYVEFEGEVRRSVADKPCVDWPDYEAQGARLQDVPGLAANPHGLWASLNNGIAIARAVSAKLQELAPQEPQFATNLERFVEEVRAAQAAGLEMAQSQGTAGQTLVAVVPGVADCILNVGMKVGKVLLPTEGASFAGAGDVQEVLKRLRSGEWKGLVCPLNAARSKPGEIARQIAREANSRVYYVQFLQPSNEAPSYLAQAYYNAAVLTGGAGKDSQASAPSVLWPVLTAVIPLGLVIALLLVALAKARQAARTALPGPGIFGDG